MSGLSPRTGVKVRLGTLTAGHPDGTAMVVTIVIGEVWSHEKTSPISTIRLRAGTLGGVKPKVSADRPNVGQVRTRGWVRAMPYGAVSAGIGAPGAGPAVAIGVSVLAPLSVTNIVELSGVAASSRAPGPAGTVGPTVGGDPGKISVTALLASSAAKTLLWSGVSVIPCGSFWPSCRDWTMLSVAVEISYTTPPRPGMLGLVTHRVEPSGLTVSPHGPTAGICGPRVNGLTFTTDTALPVKLVT